jgi:divalent metal cation (Fe/Co/Zn/Cd) transporter
MDVVVSLAVLLTLATVATIRWAGHNFGHALVAFLAGLFVATTSAGPVIRNAVESVATALLHAHH